jgi:hypothetical protein
MMVGIMTANEPSPSPRFLTIEDVALVMFSPCWAGCVDLRVCIADMSATDGPGAF